MHSFLRNKLKKELTFKYSKSSGKGGQHVNKVETRVTVYFDLLNSLLFPNLVKHRIKNALKGRINEKGEVFLSVQTHRSQIKNKNLASEQLIKILIEASKSPKARKQTAPTLSSKIKRLNDKKKQAEKKRLRGSKDF